MYTSYAYNICCVQGFLCKLNKLHFIPHQLEHNTSYNYLLSENVLLKSRSTNIGIAHHRKYMSVKQLVQSNNIISASGDECWYIWCLGTTVVELYYQDDHNNIVIKRIRGINVNASPCHNIMLYLNRQFLHLGVGQCCSVVFQFLQIWI